MLSSTLINALHGKQHRHACRHRQPLRYARLRKRDTAITKSWEENQTEEPWRKDSCFNALSNTVALSPKHSGFSMIAVAHNAMIADLSICEQLYLALI